MALDTTNLANFLKGITNAIRAKTGSTVPIKHNKIDEEINKLNAISLINNVASDDVKAMLRKIIGGGNVTYDSAHPYKSYRENWKYVFAKDHIYDDDNICPWDDDTLSWLNIDTSSGTNFSSMFENNTEITSAPQFDYSKGTKFYRMFSNCLNLKSVNLSGKLINGVTFESMFSDCESLESVELGDIKKGVTFESMFMHAGYKGEGLSITFSDLPMAEDFNNMFFSSKAISITFGNTPKLKNLSDAFAYSRSLETVIMSDTSNVTSFERPFAECVKLKHVSTLSFKSLGKTTGQYLNVFDGLKNIETILFEKDSIFLDYFNCATSSDKLTDETIQSVIDGYAYTDYSKTCIFNSKVVERITDKQLLQAANKNLEIG